MKNTLKYLKTLTVHVHFILRAAQNHEIKGSEYRYYSNFNWHHYLLTSSMSCAHWGASWPAQMDVAPISSELDTVRSQY